VEEIIISKDVELFFHDLVDVLYENEYFGFRESAKEYVDKIFEFIYTELPKAKHKPTPEALLKHGPYYTKYSAGKRTAWYVFFDKKDNRYLIEYITNNHVTKASFLNALK
jgi:hypothetical protein